VIRGVVCVALLCAAVLAGGACNTTKNDTRLGPDPTDTSGGAPKPVEIVREDRVIDVAVTADVHAQLGAQLVHPKDTIGPAIIIVPGANDVSRAGLREGNGVALYPKPGVAVSTAWADALAARGATVLVYDKRTCGPNNDPVCTKNPQDDWDSEGPTALAKDVDAACELMKKEPSSNGRIVLFTHGQGAQVVLSSSCAKTAAAIVLAAPIPRGVDEVMVANLKERLQAAERAVKAEKDETKRAALVEEAAQLRNLAGTKEAEFASMKAGRFAPTAKVLGATLAFWKGWIDSTAKTTALADGVGAPKIVVLGADDGNYAAADKKRIAALASAGFVEVKGADHHLLTDGKLAPTTVDLVGAALDKALGVPTS
jgi:alpha-beta hydrolase superfamily lysophospholipase